MKTLELTEEEHRIIMERRQSIKDLWIDYNERLEAYAEGLTHAGDVIGRRKFLINCGETVPEIILNGYKCPRDQS